MFYKGENFYDFMFAFPDTEAFCWGVSLLSFRVDPFSEEKYTSMKV